MVCYKSISTLSMLYLSMYTLSMVYYLSIYTLSMKASSKLDALPNILQTAIRAAIGNIYIYVKFYLQCDAIRWRLFLRRCRLGQL